MSLIFARVLFVTLFWKHGLGLENINEGATINRQNAPYLTSVVIKQGDAAERACLGVILSESYILTSAKCISNNAPKPALYSPSDISVPVGTSNTDNPAGEPQALKVSQIFFRESGPIAILKLSSKIMLNGVNKKAATLPTDVGGFGTSLDDIDNLDWIQNVMLDTSIDKLTLLDPSQFLPFPFNILYWLYNAFLK